MRALNVESEFFAGYDDTGSSGALACSASKFVEGLNQPITARLPAIDAELAARFDGAPVDKAQKQTLIHEVLYRLGV